MATGYTYDVVEGKLTDFKAFALRCAHAFGALITLKEESMDCPIPEFKPEPYYEAHLAEAKNELSKLRAMTPADCEAMALQAYREVQAGLQKSYEESLVVRDRLLAMRSKAADWRPPTSEHQGLKDFMIQQLDDTLKWEGNPKIPEVQKKTGAEWLAVRVESAERDIQYYTQERDKEIKRCDERNRWVKELRASLVPKT